tara:strand:+ start:1172 stop:1318 length:147 start_codon:yes stop_codon:yes gene_type:complete
VNSIVPLLPESYNKERRKFKKKERSLRRKKEISNERKQIEKKNLNNCC